VIAQIERQNPVARREVLGDRPPIAAGAKQSVEDRDRRRRTEFVGGELERHASPLSLQNKDPIPCKIG
jgi:hypothetical protein